MTLRELKNITNSTKGVKTPGPKALRESGTPVVAECTCRDGSLKVYENGFAIYKRDKYVTVFSVHDCGDYSYFSATTQHDIDENCLLDQEYSTLLLMVGEDRITHNMHSASEDREVSYSNQETEWGAMRDDSQDVLGKLIREETLREAFACMTERQAQIVKLYYLEQMTTREISEILDISHQAVTKNLKLGLANAQKKLKKF